MIPELQNNVSKCLKRKYTNTQVYKYTIQHKYTIRHKYSLVQIVAKSYALHVSLHLASTWSKDQGVTYCNPIISKKLALGSLNNECQDSDGGDKKDDGAGDDEQDGGEVWSVKVFWQHACLPQQQKNQQNLPSRKHSAHIALMRHSRVQTRICLIFLLQRTMTFKKNYSLYFG